jgi:hypothetical protein
MPSHNSQTLQQAWRDLNPQPPDLESGALANCATGLYLTDLPGLFVQGAFVTPWTIFFKLHSSSMLTFILVRRIIPSFAFCTF